MKRLYVFLLICVLSLNVVSLAYASSPCLMSDMDVAMQDDDQKPSCHETADAEKKAPSKHCKGICLCQHVLLGATYIPSDVQDVSVVIYKDRLAPAPFVHLETQDISPPYRPPITRS